MNETENQLLKSNFIAQEFLENLPFIPPFPELHWFWHKQRNKLHVTADVCRDFLTEASLVRYEKLTSPSTVTHGHPRRFTHDLPTADCEQDKRCRYVNGHLPNGPPLGVHS